MNKHRPPLAESMRPKSLSDLIGQEHILGPGKILTRMVEADRLSSILLFGPPGIGKTTIAKALANDLNLPFVYVNAGVHGKKELQEAVKDATPDNPVIMLLDEIHRIDKPKQDFLLLYLEQGSVILLGATTENPHIAVAPALRSRSHIFELFPPSVENIAERLLVALNDTENGLGDLPVQLEDLNILTFIAQTAGGDVRRALNALELMVLSTKPQTDGTIFITQSDAEACIQKQTHEGDKDGDSHYNLLSAFQKSIRGSDADASLHYLARLLASGDLISVLRRLLVIAYEDVGLANPEIPMETLAAIQTAEKVGLPEARIPLAHITVRLALSEKSNAAYKALDRASADLQKGLDLSIPMHLKDTHYKGAGLLGRGVGYQYPHDLPFGIAKQQYLPDSIADINYLEFRQTEASVLQDRYIKLSRYLRKK